MSTQAQGETHMYHSLFTKEAPWDLAVCWRTCCGLCLDSLEVLRTPAWCGRCCQNPHIQAGKLKLQGAGSQVKQELKSLGLPACFLDGPNTLKDTSCPGKEKQGKGHRATSVRKEEFGVFCSARDWACPNTGGPRNPHSKPGP